MRRALAFAVVCAACADERFLEADVPSGVTHLGSIELDGARFVGGTPLRRYDSHFETELDPAHQLLIVGYAEEDLTGKAGELSDNLERAPLKVADRCEPKLPVPRWVRRWEGAELVEALPESAPPLSAGWLEERCEVPAAEGLLHDARCDISRCGFTVIERSPCALELDWGACNLGRQRFSFEEERVICVESAPDPSWQCEIDTPIAEGRPLFRCGLGGARACPVELIPAAREDAPVLNIAARHRFGVESTAVPGNLSSPKIINRIIYRFGQAFGMAAFGDRVVIAASPEGMLLEGCPLRQPRRMLILDADSLEPIRTATAPDCLETLVPLPDGSGFLASFTNDDEQPVIGRFDRDGNLRASRNLLSSSIDTDRFFAQQIVPFGDGWLVWADIANDIEGEHDSRFYTLSAALEVTGSFIPGDSIAVPADAGNGRVVYWHRADDSSQSFRLLSAPSFDDDDERRVANPITDGYRPSALAVLGDQFVVLAEDDAETLIYDLESFSNEAVLAAVGRTGWQGSLTRWPGAPNDVLLAGGAHREGNDIWAELYFIAPRQLRFLAGSRPILDEDGAPVRGPVSDVVTDARGRVFVLLPWRGEVVRLEP